MAPPLGFWAPLNLSVWRAAESITVTPLLELLVCYGDGSLEKFVAYKFNAEYYTATEKKSAILYAIAERTKS